MRLSVRACLWALYKVIILKTQIKSRRTSQQLKQFHILRNTIEFVGLWEKLNNPNFKLLEFEGFKKEAGLK